MHFFSLGRLTFIRPATKHNFKDNYMGTLGNQPHRDNHRVDDRYLDEFIAYSVKLAAKYKVSIESVIEARRVLEMERANNLRNLAGDYHDEHMGGFGQVLGRIADALESRSV